MTLCSVILRRVWLSTVSHCAESDSVQYHTARSPLCAVLAIFQFSKYFRNIITYVDPKSPEIEVFKNQIKLFDSAQYHTARSPTRGVWLSAVSHCAESDSAQCEKILILRGVGLSAVWYCAVSHCTESRFLRISSPKRIFHRNHLRPRTQMGWINEEKKCQKILRHCLFKV